MLKQAAFLVGGKGTRLGPLTSERPKPLLEVADKPFLDHLIEKAMRHGLTDIVLLAGHLGHLVSEHYSRLHKHGVKIRVVTESEPLGTGGALRHAWDRLDDAFLLCNGDTFFDFNWRDLVPIGLQPGRAVTVALRPMDDAGRYSPVSLDGDRITGFGTGPAEGPALINGGVYLVQKALMDRQDVGPCSLENDILPRYAQAGSLFGAVRDSYFIDIGIPDDLSRARQELAPRTRPKAVFFDRDGTLNVDHGHVHTWQDFEWTDGAVDAIRRCNELGYLVFVVTNQAGVARGLYEESAITELHDRINSELAARGAFINRFEYCPHHLDGVREEYRRACHRRKPNPGMIEACLKDWSIDASDCLLIGDKKTDLEAARACGVEGHLFTGGNLLAFAEPLLGQRRSPEMRENV